MKILNKSTFVLFFAFAVVLVSCQTTGRTEPFTVNHNSPQIPLGDIDVQFDTFLSIGGLKKQTVKVIYYPKEDAVCIQYKQDFFTFNQFWSRAGRNAFKNAFQRYNEEYDARTLKRTGNSSKVYGKVQGYLIWQQSSFTVRAHAGMSVELGYGFKEKVPYFVTNQRSAEFIDPNSNDNYRNSQTIPMFYTRAQAAELIALFEQSLLNDLRGNIDTQDDPREAAKDDY